MLGRYRLLLVWFASILAAHGAAVTLSAEQRPAGILPGAKVYIAPVDDLDQFLKAAIYMKEVPVVVLTDRGSADCEITVSSGTDKSGRASIRVVDLPSSAVVFAYEGVWTEDKQDLVIDFAKQLKKRIEQDERLARKSVGAKPTPKPEVKASLRPPPKIVAQEPPNPSVQSQPNTTTQGRPAAEPAVVAAQPSAGSEPAPPVASVAVTPSDRAVRESAGTANGTAPANATVPAKDSATASVPVQIVCPEGIRHVPFASSRPDRKTIPCAEPVSIIGGRPPWIRVRTRDGIEGSVSSRFLENR